jgi:hypothetical protein
MSLDAKALDVLFHACGLQTMFDRKATRDYYAATPDSADEAACRRLIAAGLARDVGRNSIYTGFNIRITEDGKQLAERLWRERMDAEALKHLSPRKRKVFHTKKAARSRAIYMAWFDVADSVSFRDYLTSAYFKEHRESAAAGAR